MKNLIAYLLENPIVLTGSLAAMLAIWGVISQRQISRRKSTFDYIGKLTNDPDWISAADEFAKCVENGTLESLANSGMLTSPEARKIQLLLNNYENVSIGIQYGIIDFKIIKDNWRSNIKYHWTKGNAFIVKMREKTKTPTLFCEFEKLHHWINDNKKPSFLIRIRYLLF